LSELRPMVFQACLYFGNHRLFCTWRSQSEKRLSLFGPKLWINEAVVIDDELELQCVFLFVEFSLGLHLLDRGHQLIIDYINIRYACALQLIRLLSSLTERLMKSISL
jgi:hypothetical protein